MDVLNKMIQVTSSNLNLLEEQEHTLSKHLNRMNRNVEMDTLMIEQANENLDLIDSLFDEETYTHGGYNLARVQRQLMTELFTAENDLVKSERKVRDCEDKLTIVRHQISECHAFMNECETMNRLRHNNEQQDGSEQEENICYLKDF